MAWISRLIASAVAGVMRSPCVAFGRSVVRSASASDSLTRPYRLLGPDVHRRLAGDFLGLFRRLLPERLRLVDIGLQRGFERFEGWIGLRRHGGRRQRRRAGAGERDDEDRPHNPSQRECEHGIEDAIPVPPPPFGEALKAVPPPCILCRD